jgi:hypothetical protein
VATAGPPGERTTFPPPARTETPTGTRIVVPDLTGLTEDQAVEALDGVLVLGNPTGRDGHVRQQDPLPGTLVEPASAVTILLSGPPPPSRLPLVLLGVLVAAAVAGMLAGRHVRRRRRREERWVREQVRTELQPQKAVLSVVPDHVVPGLDVRLEVHRHPARL